MSYGGVTVAGGPCVGVGVALRTLIGVAVGPRVLVGRGVLVGTLLSSVGTSSWVGRT
jgi:hypothetical protein